MVSDESYQEFVARRKGEAGKAKADEVNDRCAQQRSAKIREALVHRFEAVRALIIGEVGQARQDVRTFANIEVVDESDEHIEVSYRRIDSGLLADASLVVKLTETGQVDATIIPGGCSVTNPTKIEGMPIAVDLFTTEHAVNAVKEFVQKADKAAKV